MHGTMHGILLLLLHGILLLLLQLSFGIGFFLEKYRLIASFYTPCAEIVKQNRNSYSKTCLAELSSSRNVRLYLEILLQKDLTYMARY